MRVKFNSINDFNTWHEDIMLKLNIPNSETKTERYTEPILHPFNGTLIAPVEDNIDITGFEILTKEQCFEQGYYLPLKPFNSWVLDEATCQWNSPIAYPQDGKVYLWNEELLQWKEITND